MAQELASGQQLAEVNSGGLADSLETSSLMPAACRRGSGSAANRGAKFSSCLRKISFEEPPPSCDSSFCCAEGQLAAAVDRTRAADSGRTGLAAVGVEREREADARGAVFGRGSQPDQMRVPCCRSRRQRWPLRRWRGRPRCLPCDPWPSPCSCGSAPEAGISSPPDQPPRRPKCWRGRAPEKTARAGASKRGRARFPAPFVSLQTSHNVDRQAGGNGDEPGRKVTRVRVCVSHQAVSVTDSSRSASTGAFPGPFAPQDGPRRASPRRGTWPGSRRADWVVTAPPGP